MNDGVNNIGIKREKEKRYTIKKRKNSFRNLIQFSLLIKVLELFLIYKYI
jgi:hypothetical protein